LTNNLFDRSLIVFDTKKRNFATDILHKSLTGDL